MKTAIIITLTATALLGMALVCCSTKSATPKVEKLDQTQIEKFVTSLEKPDYSFREALFMEDTDYFIQQMPKLSLDQLESFLEIVNSMNEENNITLQMKESVDASMKGGFNAAVNKYSSMPGDVFKNIAERDEYAHKLASLKSALTSNIEKKRNQVFDIPEGELVYYEDRTFGGMLPGTTFQLEKKDDGKTYLTASIYQRDTTFVVPDTTLKHVTRLFIEGKAYEVAPLYITIFRIYDAPSWSMEARFSSGKTFSSYGQQSSPNNEGISKIQQYLYSIAPKPDELGF